MYKRRIIIFMFIAGAMMLALVVRLAQLQVLEVDEFRAQWEESMRKQELLPTSRGRIMDSHGRILAVDLPCKDFCLDYRFLIADARWVRRQVSIIARRQNLSRSEAQGVYDQWSQDTWRLAGELAAAAGVDLDRKVQNVVQSVQRVRNSAAARAGIPDFEVREERQMHPIVEALNEDLSIYAQNRIAQGKTIGATVRPGNKRFYPYGDIACHVIGLTGPLTLEDLERLNGPDHDDLPLSQRLECYQPGDWAGISGVERMCEEILRGKRGYNIQQAGWRQPVQLENVPAQKGGDVHLTLDIDLQRELAKLIAATGHNGSAVVMSVERNEILAMVSSPTYDLNTYREKYSTLLGDQHNLPLRHRAVSVAVPPGSIIKPFVALAGMTEGKITQHSTFQCAGHLYPDDPLHWRCTGVHGQTDLRRSLARSCNIYYYRLGAMIGAPLMCQWFRKLGLDGTSGLNLVEERPGSVPTDEWLSRNENRRHLQAEASQMAIGQGRLLVTPLAMANALASLGRGGKLMNPMLALEDPPQAGPIDLGFNQSDIAAVLEGMHNGVHEVGGTAYRAFHPPGAGALRVQVCGKTGTAQAAPLRIDSNGDGRIDSHDEVVKQGYMMWFAALAPANDPKVALVIVLEHVSEGGGGSVAGPIGRELIALLERLGYLE
jgi:penicillin-binding protein 2